jgi:formiminotetrahydrofolate cyclodeaminase
MKDYLKKLGKTKFQAYLLVTLINAITFFLYLKGYVQTDDQVEKLMPAVNLIVQMLATFVYQWIEGSIDREAQKQQVYMVPGTAAAQQETATAAQSVSGGSDLPWSEIMARVKAVNAELNGAMDHMDKNNLTDIGKAAISRYLAIHQLLQEMPPLPVAKEGETDEQSQPVPGQD